MSEMTEYKARKRLNKAEAFVSQALRIGVLLSAAVIFAGLILFLVRGESGYSGTFYPTHFREIFMGAWDGKPSAILLTGLILLILTPIMRVGVSILVFFIERDWLYVGISSIVFIILFCSFFFGK